jgi:hypothetical protein
VLKTPGWTTLDLDSMRGCPTREGGRLDEGTSCTWFGSSTPGVGMISLEASEWNHRVTRLVRADPSEGRSLARLLSVIPGNFAADVVEQIQRAAVAVNPVWSLVGSWAGSDGYADLGDIGFGISGFGCGCGGGGSTDTIGIGTIGTSGSKDDLRSQLAVGVERCRIGDAKVKIAVELTLSEIVDVDVETSDARVHDCVVEAVWNTDIVVTTNAHHAHAVVVFGR